MIRFPNREGLLNEIRRLAEGRVPDAELSALTEADAHLDASVGERLKMGSSAEVAEIEALEQFGAPTTYLKQILRRSTKHSNRNAFVFALVATSSLAAATAFPWHTSPIPPLILFFIPWLCCGWLGVLGRRSAHVSWRGLMLATLVAVPLSASILSIANVGKDWSKTESKEDLERNVRWAKADVSQAIAQRAQFHVLRAKAIDGLRASTGPFYVPHLLNSHDGGFAQKAFASHSAATKALEVETRLDEMMWKDNLATETSWGTESSRMLATPTLLNIFRLLPFGLYISASAFAFLIASNALGALLFWVGRSHRLAPLRSVA